MSAPHQGDTEDSKEYVPPKFREFSLLYINIVVNVYSNQ